MTDFLAFLIGPGIAALVVLVVVIRRRSDQERADGVFRRLGLEHTADPDATWDQIVPIPRDDESENRVRRMVLPGDRKVRSRLRFDPTNAWVRRLGHDRPGVVAAFRLKVHTKSSSSTHHKTTTRMANEAITFRLRQGTGVQMYLEPDYRPMSPEQGERFGAMVGMADELRGSRLDDPLLYGWYLQGFGTIDASAIRSNRRLRAVLWALRVSAPTPKGADVADIASLESVIPATETLRDYDFLAIDDDLVTIVRQGGIGHQGISDRLANLAEHVSSY